jgi:DNA-binding response OmpR family regulator
MEAPRLLVVEDDTTIREGLCAAFTSEGYDVAATANATDALVEAESHPPNVVLLDIGLPDGDGIALCRKIRGISPEARIVMLTARREEIDAVVSFDAGADDYVSKPFRLAELLARVRAHVRRSAFDDRDWVRAGPIEIDVDARRAFNDGRELELTPKEFDLLALLVTRAGTAVTREEIMSAVWDEHWFGPTKTLDMHISMLRKKLGADATRLVTLRHVGYRIDP